MSLFDTQRFLQEQEIKASQPPTTLPQANLTDPMEGQSLSNLIFGSAGGDEFTVPEGFEQPSLLEQAANPINLLSLMSGRGTTGALGIRSPGMADDFLSIVRGFDKPVKTTSDLPVLGRSGAVTKVDDALPAVTKADDLPVLGKGSTAVSTTVRGGGTKGTKLIDAEVTDVPKKLTNAQKAALIGGTTFAATAPFVGDGGTDAETVASEEQKKALSNFYSDYLMTLPEADRGRAAAGIVAGLEARAQREADRAEYEKNVAEMKAESEMKRLMKMAKQPGFKELVEAGIIGGDAATSAANIDFTQLAREQGAKGSGVRAMADLLEAEFKREEAESKAKTAPAAPTMDKYDKAVSLVDKLIADQPRLASVRDDLIRRALGLENLDKAGTVEQILEAYQVGGSDSGVAVTDTLGVL
jgi:hypothetical protein